MISKEEFISQLTQGQKKEIEILTLYKPLDRIHEALYTLYIEFSETIPDADTESLITAAIIQISAYLVPPKVDDDYEMPESEYEAPEPQETQKTQEIEKKSLSSSVVGYPEHKRDLNKIDYSGLPNYNIVCLWNTHLASQYIYPELVFQNALMWICGIVMKRVYMITEDIFGKEFDDPLYTILYALGLAPTGSCKTTVFRTVQKSMKRVIGKDNFAPNSPAPETLQKSLAESIIETRMNKRTGLMEKQEFFYDGLIHPNSWKNMWDEEIGGFFTKFKKPYMAGIEPLMCSLFSGEMPPKTNSGEKQGDKIDYVADDVFLSVNGFTVPENMKLLETSSSDNGNILRYIITMATYDIPLPPQNYTLYDDVGMLDFENQYAIDEGKETRLKAIDNAGIIIDMLLDMKKRDGRKLRVQYHPKALQIIKNWEISMRDQYKGNPHIKTMRSRHTENAYKIASLLEIGNIPYHVVSKEGKFVDVKTRTEGTHTDISDVDDLFEKLASYDIKKLDSVILDAITVSPQTMEFTLKMFDRIYLPHALEACKMLLAGDDADTEKVYSILDDAKKITKQEALERADDIKKAIMHSFEELYFKAERIRDEDAKKTQLDWLNSVVKERCKEAIETLQEIPQDSIITTITREKLTKKFRSSVKKLDPVIETLKQCGTLFEYYMRLDSAKKPTTIYIYLKDNSTELVLPASNYENYTGTGVYQTGMKFNCLSSELAAQQPNTKIESSEHIESQIQTVMSTSVSIETQVESEW